MNWTDRSITANVVIRTITDDFVSQFGEWKEVTKENIWNLINGGFIDIEYIPAADNSTDTFIITERKTDA